MSLNILLTTHIYIYNKNIKEHAQKTGSHYGHKYQHTYKNEVSEREREREAEIDSHVLSKEARFTHALLAAATGSLTKTRFSQEEINVAFYTVSKNDVTPESFCRLP